MLSETHTSRGSNLTRHKQVAATLLALLAIVLIALMPSSNRTLGATGLANPGHQTAAEASGRPIVDHDVRRVAVAPINTRVVAMTVRRSIARVAVRPQPVVVSRTSTQVYVVSLIHHDFPRTAWRDAEAVAG